MNLSGVESEMQEDKGMWSLWPVQGIDTVLTNRYGRANKDALSLLYCDLYLRQFKESLKHTMLEQESVFEHQIHELHRVYQRQKELMMEVEGTNKFSSPKTSMHWMSSSVSISDVGVVPPENASAKVIDVAGFSPSPEMEMEGTNNSCSPSTSIHWMSSSVSISDVGVVPPEDASAKVIDEAGFSGDEHDISEEEEGLKNGKVHEITNFPDHPSPRISSFESVVQRENVQQLTDLPSFSCALDLNEPAMIEEPPEYELNRCLNPAKTRSERSEPEAQDLLISTKRQAENGIDLNMFPLSSEEKETVFKTKESEQPQEIVSVSSQGKQGSGPSRVLVQALPCSKTILFFSEKRYIPPRRSSWSQKKTKRGANSTKARERLNIDLNVGIYEDGSHLLSTAPGKRRRCKRHKESGKVMKKIARRTKSKTRWRFLVAEDEEQEISAAAEAIVDMSLSDSARKSSIKTSDCFTPLHWLAKFTPSVAEDSKSEVGPSGIHSDYQLDYSEAVTLQLTEMTRKKHRSCTLVSNIITPTQKRTPRSKSRRQQQQQQKASIIKRVPSRTTFTKKEASQDLDKREKLIKPSETNDAHHSLMKNMSINWGTVTKRRRGIRTQKVYS